MHSKAKTLALVTVLNITLGAGLLAASASPPGPELVRRPGNARRGEHPQRALV